VINDHLALPNLTGMNPLLGPHTDPSLPRFLPLSDAYSIPLRRLIFLAADKLQLPETDLAEGVYAWVSGPTYESPAEGRFLRKAGADVVGMSTIPEVLAAREEGLNVAVMSLVTNFVVIPEKARSIRAEVKAEVSWRQRVISFANWIAASGFDAGCAACSDCVARRGAGNWKGQGGLDEANCADDRRVEASECIILDLWIFRSVCSDPCVWGC